MFLYYLRKNAEYLQPFDKTEHRHTLKEVGDVAEGKYGGKIVEVEEVESQYKKHH